MNYNLENYNMNDLKKIAEKMSLKTRRSKEEMIKDISAAFKQYEDYKKHKIDKYTKLSQLGQSGKQGKTYLVVDDKNNRYAMKTFKPTKSSSKIKKEFYLQKKAYKYKICPKPYDYDTVSKYILMEPLTTHLYDYLMDGKKLTKKQQYRILDIFKKLDQARVFHNDANLTNYMIHKGEIYIIDFGLAKEIDESLIKKLGTRSINLKLMTIGFILKMKEYNLDSSNYKYLLQEVSLEDREKYNL